MAKFYNWLKLSKMLEKYLNISMLRFSISKKYKLIQN